MRVWLYTIGSFSWFTISETRFTLLDYINDDGTLVEPKWYCPILPMVLINGMVGIGTGFSTRTSI